MTHDTAHYVLEHGVLVFTDKHCIWSRPSPIPTRGLAAALTPTPHPPTALTALDSFAPTAPPHAETNGGAAASTACRMPPDAAHAAAAGTHFTCIPASQVQKTDASGSAGYARHTAAKTQFTCFTSTKVQILTPEKLLHQAASRIQTHLRQQHARKLPLSRRPASSFTPPQHQAPSPPSILLRTPPLLGSTPAPRPPAPSLLTFLSIH